MKSGKLRAGQFWLLKLAGRRALWLMLGVIFCAGGCVSARRVVLISAAIDSALSGASLSVFFEVELSSVVNGATRYETVCQETAQLRRDYITH